MKWSEKDYTLFLGFNYIDPFSCKKTLNDLLNGRSLCEKKYVYDYCMNWNPDLEESFLNLEKLDKLNWKYLPVQTQVENKL